jgi:hypothetical protein
MKAMAATKAKAEDLGLGKVLELIVGFLTVVLLALPF